MSDTNLDHLTDEQNHLLMELAYHSHTLAYYREKVSIEQIIASNPVAIRSDLAERLLNAGLGDLVIIAVKDDQGGTGFGAIAFEDSHGNVGFSFRGTDGVKLNPFDPDNSLNDWIDNGVAMLYGTSAQSKEALAFFNRYKGENGNNHLFGHSKAGELTTQVFVNNYSEIEKIHLLNAQPINPYALSSEQIEMLNSEKVDAVVIEGDFVWSVGVNAYIGRIRWARKVEGKDAHLFSAVYDEANGIVETESLPSNVISSSLLALFLLGSEQRKGATSAFIYEHLIKVYNYAKYDMIDDINKVFIYLAEEIKKYIEVLKTIADVAARGLIVMLDEIVDELEKLAGSLLELLRMEYTLKGYVYASMNPIIEVDTRRLRGYADRLERVNKRLGDLDARISRLYWKVGYVDLIRLMVADFKIEKSGIINGAVKYLRDTAEDFDAVEKEIMNKLN